MHLKNKYVALFLITFFFCSTAESQTFEWVNTIGGTNTDDCQSSAVDNNGNTFSVGSFYNDLTFDTGTGPQQVFTAGYSDIFIAKYDPTGQLLWIKTIGGKRPEGAYDIAIDKNNNIVFTGSFSDTVDFDPGAGISQLRSPYIDISYICKLDNDGNFVWAKSFTGQTGNGQSIQIGTDNSVYTVGKFSGNTDFNPSPSQSFYINSGSLGLVYLSKLDESGNFMWAKKVETTQIIHISALALDSNNNALLGGHFYGSIKDPNTGSNLLNSAASGSADAYVMKYDDSGNFIWGKNFGGTGNDILKAITVDASGTVYTTGQFAATADFNPGTDVYNLSSTQTNSCFINVLDSNGTFVRAIQLGGAVTNTYTVGNSIRLDAGKNIYLTGSFSGTTDFDPGSGTYNLSAVNTLIQEMFVCKLTETGNFVWAYRIGGNSNDYGMDIQLDSQGSIYTSGIFGLSPFDLLPLSPINITSLGSSDGIIFKLSQCQNHYTDTQAACDSLQWLDGKMYYASNNAATISYQTTGGCDSIIHLNLTINQSYIKHDTVTACDSYDWKGTSLTSSGLFNYAGTTQFGCDSLLNLVLTINQSTASSESISACSNYLWNGTNYSSSGTYQFQTTNTQGCDSTATLNLIIMPTSSSNETTTACDSYNWNGNNYVSSGAYTFVSTNQFGCDSTATLQLTINNSSNSLETLSSCNTYDWNGNSYTLSGTYQYVTTNAMGCDSTATLVLTINSTTSSQAILTACDSLIWNGTTHKSSGNYSFLSQNAMGCDSTANLLLTINNSSNSLQNINSCLSYDWNGNNYLNSGTYTFMTTNSFGCDSTATLQLQIIKPDTSVNVQSDALFAIGTGTYNWLNCSDNYSMIAGENGQNFIPFVDGSYALEIIQDGCKDTSACYFIDVVGLVTVDPILSAAIHPNPNNGIFTFKLDKSFGESTAINIRNTLGQTVAATVVIKDDLYTISFEGESGIYFLAIGNSICKKIIKL